MADFSLLSKNNRKNKNKVIVAFAMAVLLQLRGG